MKYPDAQVPKFKSSPTAPPQLCKAEEPRQDFILDSFCCAPFVSATPLAPPPRPTEEVGQAGRK